MKPPAVRDKHWSIGIAIEGEEVVRIEPAMVGGKDLSEEEHAIACRAVRNLAAFLGCEELEHD